MSNCDGNAWPLGRTLAMGVWIASFPFLNLTKQRDHIACLDVL